MRIQPYIRVTRFSAFVNRFGRICINYGDKRSKSGDSTLQQSRPASSQLEEAYVVVVVDGVEGVHREPLK